MLWVHEFEILPLPLYKGCNCRYSIQGLCRIPGFSPEKVPEVNFHKVSARWLKDIHVLAERCVGCNRSGESQSRPDVERNERAAPFYWAWEPGRQRVI